jgi:hypothetical protein
VTAFTQANFMDLIVSAEGTPYLYGGTNPFAGGADCSGLIYWAGQQCGVTLPRTTQAEWADLPHSTNWAAAPYASIIEFEVPSDGGSPPQHVGVNIGGGYMIDDPETGEVVSVQAIPSQPGVIWPIGYCTLPFVSPTPPPPPVPKLEELEEMDATTAPNGDIVSHAMGAEGTAAQGHYFEITRKAGTQGQPPTAQNISIIDMTATWSFFQVGG